MKLIHRKEHFNDEYRCDLTLELDQISGLSEKEGYYVYHHYLLADRSYVKDHLAAIRVPGGTVGSIRFDGNHKITQVYIDTSYALKTYPKNVNELMKKFIGKKIKLV